jgi:hypothetical protein
LWVQNAHTNMADRLKSLFETQLTGIK